MTIDYKQAAELLRQWDNILILTHRRPDGDTLGSGAALCEILRRLGKTAWMLESLDALDLFSDYLKGRAAPPEFVPDKVVSVDIADEGLFPPNAERYKGNVDLLLDHHPSNTGFAAHCCVEAGDAACGELVFKVARELGAMDREIATLLYVAVSTDTGCFAYGNTTADSHRIAAELIEQGIDTPQLNKKHFRTKSFKRLQLEGLIVRNMELYQDGTLVVAPITLEMMDSIGATVQDSEDIAAFAGQVEGALHAATIREMKPGECRVSLRTDPRFLSATQVCMLLGGGGHAGAAGCTVYGTMREAVDAVLRAVETVQGKC